MTITAKDFRHLRWSLLLFVVMLLIGTGIVLAARHLVGAADRTQRELAMQQSDIRGRLARARDEEQEIRSRISRYQEMLDRGIIGQEQRLDWVEKIAQIKTARRLIDVQYELAPQKPVDANQLPGGPTAGGYEFMVSSMKLQMQLLHEDDLLGFLADLKRAVHAHLQVRECKIQRVPRTAGERSIQAQLTADCTIDWITLREKT